MYYRQPRYFSDFHCIGPECKDNCCYGWRIDWDKEEVEKVKNAPSISPELRELVEKSFIPNIRFDGKYQIKFDERGKCPCVTEEGWCRIQRELGSEYLSSVCMGYPRRYNITADRAYCFCDSSCREIVKKIMEDSKAMDLVNKRIKQKTDITDVTLYSNELKASYPELNYSGELLEFFYELISDKRHDVETNIILGALAAQSLTKLVTQGESDRIPETLKSFRSQMHNAEQLRSIENIKPNYALRFGFIGKLLKEIVGFSMIDFLNDKTGTPNIDYYNAAHAQLNEIFKDRPFYLRNIALNLLLEFVVPFKFVDKTIFENYCLFAAAYSCIKLNLIAIALTTEHIEINVNGQQFNYVGDERFIGLTSIICRGICQNRIKQKLILDFLKKYGFTSPAYIALLVK